MNCRVITYHQKNEKMPLEDHPRLIVPDPKLVIWRYMDLEKFESLLANKSLFFCRSDKFSDPFEGSVTQIVVAHRVQAQKDTSASLGHIISEEEAITKSNSIASLHNRFRKSLVVNCWHINQNESDAMWRLYLKTNEGVAIQSSVHRLQKSVEGCEETLYISKVRYIDYEKDIWFHEVEYPETTYDLITPIIHKRRAFIHENELRLFQHIPEAVGNETYWNGKPHHKGKFIPSDIDILIEKIILPPTSDDYVREKVMALLARFDLKKEIEKSKLTEEPIY